MSQTKNTFKRIMHLSLLASVGFAALLYGASPALAQIAPDLGTAGSYTVLSATPAFGGAVTCTTSTINGDLGSTGGLTQTTCTISGTPTLAIPDSPVVNDFNSAYSDLNTQNPTCTILNGTLAGQSPAPGVYCIDPSGKTGTLTLSGIPTDIWIFKSIGAAGLAGTNFNVVMGGTADACNVYWWSEAAAAMTTSNFNGTILAGTDITVTGGNFVAGRALAKGDVTVTNAILTGCPMALAPTTLSRPGPLPGGTVGVPISDTKTLSSSDGTSPTGTITFYLYGPNDATCSNPAIFTSTVTVSGIGDYDSGPFIPPAAGTYRWIANYNGDANNAATANACNGANESVVVTVPSPVALPTLNEWGVIIFMLLVGLMSIYYLRRQKAQA